MGNPFTFLDYSLALSGKDIEVCIKRYGVRVNFVKKGRITFF
jgi:hypothetical protein